MATQTDTKPNIGVNKKNSKTPPPPPSQQKRREGEDKLFNIIVPQRITFLAKSVLRRSSH